MSQLIPALASRFAGICLRHIRREYPNKPGHILATPADARTPRDLHPVFYGSFDWHSCVHGYWMLARLLRQFPDLPEAGAIRALFDAQLTPDKIAGECRYLASPHAAGFERPYGWAWLLKLAAELGHHETQPWAEHLAPLAAILVARFRVFLPLATYPIRTGSHSNTAFALRLAADFASPGDAFAELLHASARRWYGDDRDCPAWGEPGGDDFLSPTLIEAECMRAMLPQGEFLPWLKKFLPRLAEGLPACLFVPATVSDRSDGKIAHLDGLNLSRAWCFQSLAAGRERLLQAAEQHRAAALAHVTGDYMGEHWLATFAVMSMLE